MITAIYARKSTEQLGAGAQIVPIRSLIQCRCRSFSVAHMLD
jgi:hypothetical protein